MDTFRRKGDDGRAGNAPADIGGAFADALSDEQLTALAQRFSGDVIEARDGPPPRMRVLAPIEANGTRTGAVAAWVSLGPVQGLVERLSQVSLPGYAHAILVIGADRRFIAHTTPEFAFRRERGDQEPLIMGVSLADDRPLNANFVLQADGVRDDGTAVTGTTISLAGAGRGFIGAVQMPQSVVFSSLSKMRRVAGVVVIVAIVLAIGGAILVARSITRPVDALMQRSQALAERRFDDVTALGDRGDELGVLGRVMAGAASALKASEIALLAETRLREGLGRYLPRQLVDAYVKERRSRTTALRGRRPLCAADDRSARQKQNGLVVDEAAQPSRAHARLLQQEERGSSANGEDDDDADDGADGSAARGLGLGLFGALHALGFCLLV